MFDERTAAVVMTHHFADDVAILNALLPTPVKYVGLLGGKTRNGKLYQEIASTNSSESLRKVFGPVGLDLGAVDPEEIAVSIVSEIMALLNFRSAGHLRNRTTSIFSSSDKREGKESITINAGQYVCASGSEW